jgi:uncharacterized protein YndB with AHSA1/START domain
VTDEYSLTVSREIAAPAEDLFDAWLDAQSLGTWLKPLTTRETRAETDPREGGTFRIVMVDDEREVVHTGTYHEIDRPRRLVFTWTSPVTQFRDTVVTVTFEPMGDGSTRVQVHQRGLPDEPSRSSHDAGWSDALRQLAESIPNLGTAKEDR